MKRTADHHAERCRELADILILPLSVMPLEPPVAEKKPEGPDDGN